MDTTEMIPEPEMKRRQIALADGRYLIFYTFASVVEVDEKEDTEKESRVEQ